MSPEFSNEYLMKFMKPPLLLIFLFIPLLSAIAHAAEPGPVPAVGALVRVEAPQLGPGWHVGMFNRLRVAPPCYRVVIFAKDGSNRITNTLEVEEIERMQSHVVYKGRKKVAPPWVLTGGKVSDDWAEVSVDALHATAAQCPS